MVTKYITHSKRAIDIARAHGWKHGARYTNLRDIRHIKEEPLGFLDIDWKNYSFHKHLEVAAATRPQLTIARDIESIKLIDNILEEATLLMQYANVVAIAPKNPALSGRISELIPKHFILAFSVPTRYGGTKIPTSYFKRPVHLLGGRPDVQRKLANEMTVISIDCNRFTYDARFGDYFDGETFRPHPQGGYNICLSDSIKQINKLWSDYRPNGE